MQQVVLSVGGCLGCWVTSRAPCSLADTLYSMIGAWKHTAFYVKIAIEMHKEHKTRQKLQERDTFAQEVSDLRRFVHWLQGYSCQLTHSLFSCCLHLIVPVLPKTVVSLPIAALQSPIRPLFWSSQSFIDLLIK
jgi:hypothetical protein